MPAFRFNLLQFLLAVAWLGVFLAVSQLVDWWYAIGVGIFLGVFFVFAYSLRSWKRFKTRRELAYRGIAMFTGLGAATLFVSLVIGDFRDMAARTRELQAELHEDARFRNVFPKYSGINGYQFLTVQGSVATQADELALRKKAADDFWYFKKTVRWNVFIDTAGKSGNLCAASLEIVLLFDQTPF